MKIEYIAKGYSISQHLKDVIESKIERIDKFFDDDTKIKILCKQVKDNFIMELTILLDNGVLRAEVFSDNVYKNIDLALPKLEKQIIRNRSKLTSKSKKARFKEMDAAAAALSVEPLPTVVKKKQYNLQPMSVDDAIAEIELVSHSFYIFKNSQTSLVNVLYKRNDGDYGIIEVK